MAGNTSSPVRNHFHPLPASESIKHKLSKSGARRNYAARLNAPSNSHVGPDNARFKVAAANRPDRRPASRAARQLRLLGRTSAVSVQGLGNPALPRLVARGPMSRKKTGDSACSCTIQYDIVITVTLFLVPGPEPPILETAVSTRCSRAERTNEQHIRSVAGLPAAEITQNQAFPPRAWAEAKAPRVARDGCTRPECGWLPAQSGDESPPVCARAPFWRLG